MLKRFLISSPYLVSDSVERSCSLLCRHRTFVHGGNTNTIPCWHNFSRRPRRFASISLTDTRN